MGEQSQRDEMNAAIRAQRERQAAQRAPVPEQDEPAVEAPAAAEPPPAETKRTLLDRLRGR
jgi:hypothetical protein